ncbi:MAG: 2-isopropylmalate synthase [Armatimonadota bacterium]
MARKITIFDTTLRDGEQSPGASMNLSEKLTLAHQLAHLNVDVIEAGFPYSSPEDFEAVHRIAEEVQGPVIAGLCRTRHEDIEAAFNAVKPAQRRRIHTFVGTSKLHVEKKLQKTEQEVLEMAVENVKYAASLCEDVEFSAEDAMRTDLEYLRDVVEATIEAGATTINIPDTVGYTLPWIMEDTIAYLMENVPNVGQATISVHCHDDLGLSVANSLAAIKAGAGQVECTINGMGERAGNASLEEIVMAIKTRSDQFDAYTDIITEEIVKTSRMVSSFTGFPVQPNKAIVGQNAFRHEAGIHQHGVIMDRQTYEIMAPEDVGWAETVLTLGPRSGKHGVRSRLEGLGYELDDEQLAEVYERFIEMADKKKQIYDEDLEILMRQATSQETQAWVLRGVEASTHGDGPSEAVVTLEREGQTYQATGSGNGPVDAAYEAINDIIGIEVTLEDYSIRGVTRGKDALGEATVRVARNGESAVGRNASTDVIHASAAAYVNALSRLIIREQMNGRKKKAAGDTP